MRTSRITTSCGTIRFWPVLALLSDKLAAKRADCAVCAVCAVLAGKSTLNRLEHAPEGAPSRYHKTGHDKDALEALFVEAHDTPLRRIVLDPDATDDAVHGHQEGRFLHGCYDCCCYLPLSIFCGRHLLAARLRPANIDGAAGATQEVARLVRQIREHWPGVEVVLRAGSGFCREELMAWCEGNGVHYLFGLARNARLLARRGGTRGGQGGA